ncbi:4-hydroxythreonine-4-phosphate dehydrogenase PdxA [Rhizobium halophytocola]
MGVENARIAVAAINPQCGENGVFGRAKTTADSARCRDGQDGRHQCRRRR